MCLIHRQLKSSPNILQPSIVKNIWGIRHITDFCLILNRFSVNFIPSTKIVPDDGSIILTKLLIVVDFPAPLCPKIQKFPLVLSRETSLLMLVFPVTFTYIDEFNHFCTPFVCYYFLLYPSLLVE